MMDSVSGMESLVRELSENIEGAADIYVIGGGAMMYLGGKLATKDLDLVVITEDEYDRVLGALLRMGFESVRPGTGYDRMNLSGILVDAGGRRVDLYMSRVCRRLRLSDGMAGRSTPRFSSSGVRLLTVSPEDILIFKSITERPGDRGDCASILENFPSLDWDAILREIREQTVDGEDVWITWIADGFYDLSRRYGVEIPILKELLRMADSFLERWERELLEASGDKPI